MKKTVLALCLSLMMAPTFAQNSDIVLTIGDEGVTKAEFEHIFRKNNKDADLSREALDEYMELFINFKLKVKEAESLGMDTVAKFLRELDGYRTQLARPYLTDDEQNESLIEEAYARKLEEIKARHLLIDLQPDASPADTLKAWKKITELRKKALSGSDFGELAREHSKDPSAKDNGGNLGYFSALQMVYPFETAAYNTPVGGISQPVRTRFGYHLIQVNDRRPSRGEIRVAHIMVRAAESDSDEKKERAERQINEVYQELQQGADFAELALTYSDDGATSGKGGELPWFGAGKMVEEFENAAFALTEDGQISEPVKSRFGWHIIKRLEYKPIASLEEMRNELKTRISKDSRAELMRKSFVQNLKDEYGFKAYSGKLKPVLAKLDTSVLKGTWDAAKAASLKADLFELDGRKYTQQDFVNYLNEQQSKRRKTESDPKLFGEKMYEQFVDETVFEYENSRLEDKYPEFKALMKEYHDGILLFELTDMMVWSMAVKDSAGLAAFYEEHKDNYNYTERAEGVVYLCKDEKFAKKARAMAKKGKTQEDVRKKLNKLSDLNVRMESVVLEKGDREYLDHIAWEPGLSENFEHNNQVAFFHIHRVLDPEPKPLSEVRGLVTAAYQNHLEAEWIKELREKYNFQVNREVLYTIK